MNPAAALSDSLARIRRIHRDFGDLFPITGEGKRYCLARNENWFAGFWPGLLWLTHAATGDEDLRHHAEALLPTFAERLENHLHLDHDLGFLFTLSACAQWKITGDETARRLGRQAAEELARRFRPNGKYLQAWGPIGDPAEGGRTIIDSLMNLPLLLWAWGQTGDDRFHRIAFDHAQTCRRYLVRPDGSTYHTYFFDQETGRPIGPRTDQGQADDSLWARGQAWAIYGFALAADWFGDRGFSDAARLAADRFLAELPESGMPWWDLRLPEGAPHYLDSSAGAIAAGGLLRLARSSHSDRRETLRAQASRLVQALLDHCFETDDEAQGLLRHGTYDAPAGNGVDGYLSFGDYFFLETLLALEGNAADFWGPERRRS